MRIWDISPDKLCRVHLLAEHRELHGIWSILTQGKKGYSNHPETLRWRGKLKALYVRHERLVEAMAARGYQHNTPLPSDLATGEAEQHEYVDSIEEQVRLLIAKGCGCNV